VSVDDKDGDFSGEYVSGEILKTLRRREFTCYFYVTTLEPGNVAKARRDRAAVTRSVAAHQDLQRLLQRARLTRNLA
jgi:hypothetical protein